LPLLIFNLVQNSTQNQIRKKYYKISLLLHPDKSFDNDRFTKLFTIITKNYKYLMENQKIKKNRK
jgi:curved DNA-binding protein CbpA